MSTLGFPPILRNIREFACDTVHRQEEPCWTGSDRRTLCGKIIGMWYATEHKDVSCKECLAVMRYKELPPHMTYNPNYSK